MREHFKFIVKGGILVTILLMILLFINNILVPKYLYGDWPSTLTFKGFYEMEENTIDVLFLGSSHCVSSFSPQEIYDSYGIRSYNLGSEQQNLLVSYYWLKEALRFQSPKAVVLDTYICFEYAKDEPLNSAEGTTRKAIDYMKWSDVKVAAINAICSNDPNQSAVSYYFPNLRFHTRYTDLNEDDFTFFEMNNYELKGYSLLADYCDNMEYMPYESGGADDLEEMVPLMKTYLTKIVELCKENDIDLILVNTPSTEYNIKKYNTMSEFAETHNLEYYDFNEKSLYDEIGFQFAVDNHDNGHLNYWGAQKVSKKIADILFNKYNILDTPDYQWEESRSFYDCMVLNAQLKHITDIYHYMEVIKDNRYTIFMVGKDEASNSLNEEILKRMNELGISGKLYGHYQSSYYAIISSDFILEEVGEKEITNSGSFRDGRCIYTVTSAGNFCSVKIDNTEYAKNGRGLNIVVYDNICKKVIDSVCFDTFDASLNAWR